MPKIFCTLIASHLLNENLPENGLKYLTKKYLKRDVMTYDEAIKYGTDSKEFAQYATADAINTYDLYKLFSPKIAREGLSKLFYKVEMPFTKALMELEINGIKADRKAAREMYFDVRHKYYSIENELLEFFGGQYNIWIMPKARRIICKPSINFNSSEQVIPLIEGLGFKLCERTAKGNKSWNAQAKKRLEGKHPIIDLLIKFGKVEKLLNGFLKKFERYIDADGRIRCSFHNTVCVTGRLSCSSPNIEQIPRNNDIANIRNLFVANDDNILIVADYGGEELRIMAEESGDRDMLTALRNGLDIHLSTANDFNKLGLTPNQLTDGTDEHKAAKEKYKPLRDKAKTISFGIAYGKGSFGFAKDFNVTEEEAQEFIDQFLNRYPALRRAIERTRQEVIKRGFVRNAAGRKRRFPDFAKLNKWQKARCFRQAFNFKIQSYGADVIKAAASKIVRDTKIKLVNVVHDELVFEVHKSYVDKAVTFIMHCMITALPLSIPWTVSIDYGVRYGECK